MSLYASERQHPASGPGEDRNDLKPPDQMLSRSEQHPASGPGEVRNLYTFAGASSTPEQHPASGPGEVRNTVSYLDDTTGEVAAPGLRAG